MTRPGISHFAAIAVDTGAKSHRVEEHTNFSVWTDSLLVCSRLSYGGMKMHPTNYIKLSNNYLKNGFDHYYFF